jgi:hypothetical protein
MTLTKRDKPFLNTEFTEALRYTEEEQYKFFYFSQCKAKPLGGGEFLRR